MEKFIEQAEQLVTAFDNINFRISNSPRTCAEDRNRPFIPKTLTTGHNPCFIYSEEKSIKFSDSPYSCTLEQFAFGYAQRKYNFECETVYYQRLVRREVYPSLEEVLKEVRAVVAFQLRFKAYLKENNIEKLNLDFCMYPGLEDTLKCMVHILVDKFYKEYDFALYYEATYCKDNASL
jgi:hypothetical protein